MKLNDFLRTNNLSWEMEQLENPTRFYITLKHDNLEVYLMGNGCKHSACFEGATSKQSVSKLIECIKGNRLRIKGWNSKDEYVDLTIKVPNDLELGE